MMPDRVDMVQRKRGRKTEVKAKTVDRTDKETRLDSPTSLGETDFDSPETINEADIDSPETSVEVDIFGAEHTLLLDMENLVEEHTVLVDIVSLVKEHTVSVDMDSLVEECFLEFTQAPGNPEPGHKTLFIGLDPVLELTFEEEFKIHELVVRKEFLQDSIFTLLLEVPCLKNFFFNFYLTGRTLDYLNFREAFRETFQATFRETLAQVFYCTLHTASL